MPSQGMEYFRRRSIRLKGYDYRRAGSYFVTLCVLGRECVFGRVEGREMMSRCGVEVARCWVWLSERYSYVALDEWVVMPNHIHGIIVIKDGGGKSLGRLVGAFKTVSTKRVNEIRATPGAVLWQRNFYEHIIRGEGSLRRIRRYIAANPPRWSEDRENPENLRTSTTR